MWKLIDKVVTRLLYCYEYKVYADMKEKRGIPDLLWEKKKKFTFMIQYN